VHGQRLGVDLHDLGVELLGPLGTGGLYIRPGIEKQMRTIREGGTGSLSEQDTQPPFLPDRFEAGLLRILFQANRINSASGQSVNVEKKTAAAA